MSFFDFVLMIAATQGGGVIILTPGPDLVTNGSFSADTDWTKTGTDAQPTISGGKIHFTDNINGTFQRATQTLAGGSTPAGTYSYAIDISSITGGHGTFCNISLLDAGGTSKGTSSNDLTNTTNRTLTGTFTTSAACTKVQILCNTANFDNDNFELHLLS